MPMALPSDLLRELADMPRQLADALRLLPADRLAWRPESWGGCPSEHFSALEQVCHLRDIEADGYYVRIRRMLEEPGPCLESLDSYEIARRRGYSLAHIDVALAEFRDARQATVARLRGLKALHLVRGLEEALQPVPDRPRPGARPRDRARRVQDLEGHAPGPARRARAGGAREAADQGPHLGAAQAREVNAGRDRVPQSDAHRIRPRAARVPSVQAPRPRW